MAPEILNRQHYKRAADIYAFAITMLETITFAEPFSKQLYPFAWNISDSIAKGIRPELINEIENNEIKQIIEQSWKQTPKDRLSIDAIIGRLETVMMKVK